MAGLRGPPEQTTHEHMREKEERERERESRTTNIYLPIYLRTGLLGQTTTNFTHRFCFCLPRYPPLKNLLSALLAQTCFLLFFLGNAARLFDNQLRYRSAGLPVLSSCLLSAPSFYPFFLPFLCVLLVRWQICASWCVSGVCVRARGDSCGRYLFGNWAGFRDVLS